MAETDASLKFDEPLDGPVTAPLSEEALSRSTANSERAEATQFVDIPADETGDSFQPGTVLGPYRLESKLGEGGMGIVFKATHTKLDKLVAIKILPSAYLSQKSALARFEREMKAVGRLQHANVVQAFDAGEEKGTHFLVMEYVEGTDLQKLVMTRGVFTIENACKAVYQAALGLEAAHQIGLIHRDIKPSNLFVTKHGQIKILDLGLARLQDDGEGGALTYSGQCFGTPEYMAPEQWEDVHTCDGRTDLYALGCTLFFLLVGHPPYGGEEYKTAPRKMLGHINDAVPELSAFRSDVPEELQHVYRTLMSKKAADRYATADELAQALAPWVDGSSAITAVSGVRVGTESGRPSAATVPERTILDGSQLSGSTNGTEAISGDERTLLHADVDDPRTTIVPPPENPSQRWLWPAIGGVTALAVLGAIGFWMTQSGSPTVPPAQVNVVNVDPRVTPDPPTVTTPSINTDAPLVLVPMAQDVIDRWVSLPGKKMTRTFGSGREAIALPGDGVRVPLPKSSVRTAIAALPLQLTTAGDSTDILAAALERNLPHLSRSPASLDRYLDELELMPTGPRPLEFPATAANVKEAQAIWAEQLKVDVNVQNSVNMELVLLPPGEFSMGSDAQNHPVKITHAFYVGKYEVLQGEYQAVMGSNPSRYSPNGFYKQKVQGLNTQRLPVDSVTWDDAIQFCNKLSAKEKLPPYYTPGGNINGGDGYRLLTEAEWEYACRAGTDSNFAFGQNLSSDLANIRDSKKRTEVAGKYLANAFGLHDFHGNVYEWCYDFYDDEFIKFAATDPVGPKKGTMRIRRGGSWNATSGLASSFYRTPLKPGESPNDAGFRVARTVVIEKPQANE